MTAAGRPEFTRCVTAAEIGHAPCRRHIVANEEERAALAERFELAALDRLEADVELRRRAGGEIRFEARFEADVVQHCVVTLEPVPASVAERFVLLFRPGIDEEEADRLALLGADDEVVEPLTGDVIDIGEAVAQQLSLMLDPYPRSEAARRAGEEPSDIGAAETSPFSITVWRDDD